MLDNFLIDHTLGAVELRIGRPVERELVLKFDRPWEGNRSGLTTVISDGPIWRMYYRGSRIDLDEAAHSIPYNYTCYAESTDGVQWSRPHLGITDFRGSRTNNIILSGQACLTFTPFLDSNPNCPEKERYKALSLQYDPPPRGLCGWASPDGIKWSQISAEPFITEGYFDSQNIAFWDDARCEYRCYLRGFRGTLNEAARETGVRDVMTCTSRDFVRWTKPQWLEYQPERFTEVYSSQIMPYYRAPHVFIGLPMRYVTGHGYVTEMNERISRSQKRFGTSYTDTGLMSSRDGTSFDMWGEAFIRPGPVQRNRWHYGANSAALGMVETQDDAGTPELSLYVKEGGFDAISRLRRYTLRTDGFASMRASAEGGELTTKPLIFSGDRLLVNFASSAMGWIRVEIQDRYGQVIDGFGENDCAEVFGDDIQHVVRWRDVTNLRNLSGTPIRLRLIMRDADLYAIRFC